jgi:sugar lactone lactonase YvrE
LYRRLLPILACAVWFAGSMPGVEIAEALQISGLQAPQSFIADPSGETYFISNVNGEPDAKDNNGFITKLDTNGKITHLRFISGGDGNTVLHAPKGMAIADGVLYVADLDALRAFDVGTGRMLRTISFQAYATNGSGVSLADVAYDGQHLLYVSDTGANTIYRVDIGKQDAVSVLVHDDSLAGPRGLAVHPKTGRIIAVSWTKGKIVEVTPDGTISEIMSNSFFSHRFSNLGGVDFDSLGYMYISDVTAGKVWRMRPDIRFDVIAEYLPSPADIGIDRKNHLILVPYEYADAAEMNGLESPAKSKRKRDLSDYGMGWMKKEGTK